MKPIIGIVGRVCKSDEDKTVISCFEGIRRSILKKGGNPIMILPSQDIDYDIDKRDLTEEEKDDLKQIIDLCDGIVMPGTTVLYKYDGFIYRYALSKNIPILGICGGMQLIAINDKKLEEENVLERIESDINHQSPGVDYVHSVNINKGTLLYDIIGKDTIRVNSRHSYKVKSVNDLIVSAISEDGIIEAIEYKDKKFVVGIQWHPENMCDYDDAANKIFERFIDSCKQ